MTTNLEPRTPTGPAATLSPNLLLNELVAERRGRGIETLHLGFGEARLPVVPELAEVLSRATGNTDYPPVAGTPGARRSVAGYFGRRRLPTEPEQVVLAPGSKPLLFAILAALGGNVYLPAPCWNSYAPQVVLSGHRPVAVPIGAEHGGLPDPRLLAERIAEDRRHGNTPAAVVVNTPDNPTGTTVTLDALHALCDVVRGSGMALVSDEIYRELHHDDSTEPGRRFTSPAELLPELTVTCTGLSKCLAIGGWRIGAARFPRSGFGDNLRARVLAIASNVWSAMSAPMQEVAAYAFDEPFAVTDRLRRSRLMHGSIARACHELCRSRGAAVRAPTGAFYVYADLSSRCAALATHGAVDSASLADVLLDRFSVAVLAGHHLGDNPRRLAFKIATTGFVGDTDDERLAALASPHTAAQLPHVQRRLDWLDRALASLTHDGGTP